MQMRFSHLLHCSTMSTLVFLLTQMVPSTNMKSNFGALFFAHRNPSAPRTIHYVSVVIRGSQLFYLHHIQNREFTPYIFFFLFYLFRRVSFALRGKSLSIFFFFFLHIEHQNGQKCPHLVWVRNKKIKAQLKKKAEKKEIPKSKEDEEQQEGELLISEGLIDLSLEE